MSLTRTGIKRLYSRLTQKSQKEWQESQKESQPSTKKKKKPETQIFTKEETTKKYFKICSEWKSLKDVVESQKNPIKPINTWENLKCNFFKVNTKTEIVFRATLPFLVRCLFCCFFFFFWFDLIWFGSIYIFFSRFRWYEWRNYYFRQGRASAAVWNDGRRRFWALGCCSWSTTDAPPSPECSRESESIHLRCTTPTHQKESIKASSVPQGWIRLKNDLNLRDWLTNPYSIRKKPGRFGRASRNEDLLDRVLRIQKIKLEKKK